MAVDEMDCPLCMEPMELDDMCFYPCACEYQICRFCWSRILNEENGLCPACRKPYNSEKPAQFKPMSEEEVAKLKKDKKTRDQQKRQRAVDNRRHLSDVRVVQKNLLFVVGLPLRLADHDILKGAEYFGKYGKVFKIAVNRNAPLPGGQGGHSAGAYVTYYRPEDAINAILDLNKQQIDGRTLKASLGTTKYCSSFLKGTQCTKHECMYLHEIGEGAASFTKEDMQQGKHTDYENQLIQAHLNSLQQQQQQHHTQQHHHHHQQQQQPLHLQQAQQQSHLTVGSVPSSCSSSNTTSTAVSAGGGAGKVQSTSHAASSKRPRQTKRSHQNSGGSGTGVSVGGSGGSGSSGSGGSGNVSGRSGKDRAQQSSPPSQLCPMPGPSNPTGVSRQHHSSRSQKSTPPSKTPALASTASVPTGQSAQTQDQSVTQHSRTPSPPPQLQTQASHPPPTSVSPLLQGLGMMSSLQNGSQSQEVTSGCRPRALLQQHSDPSQLNHQQMQQAALTGLGISWPNSTMSSGAPGSDMPAHNMSAPVSVAALLGLNTTAPSGEDDDLDFDPFRESQLALAEQMENESRAAATFGLAGPAVASVIHQNAISQHNFMGLGLGPPPGMPPPPGFDIPSFKSSGSVPPGSTDTLSSMVPPSVGSQLFSRSPYGAHQPNTLSNGPSQPPPAPQHPPHSQQNRISAAAAAGDAYILKDMRDALRNICPTANINFGPGPDTKSSSSPPSQQQQQQVMLGGGNIGAGAAGDIIWPEDPAIVRSGHVHQSHNSNIRDMWNSSVGNNCSNRSSGNFTSTSADTSNFLARFVQQASGSGSQSPYNMGLGTASSSSSGTSSVGTSWSAPPPGFQGFPHVTAASLGDNKNYGQ